MPGFELLGEIGRGGMGVVYQARQTKPNRLVALKMILAGEHSGPEAAIRFLGEAEFVASLNHPQIVQVFAFGDHDGRPYLEMEYVAGGSLADRLDGTPRPTSDAARLIATLARAIHDVHRLGIVHRDLKPANVLLDERGDPHVTDFGLAKRLDGDSSLTVTGAIMGTPSYMAPEQAGGKSKELGPACDIYALGAILHTLLTGRPPASDRTTKEDNAAFSNLPPLFVNAMSICGRCLNPQPARPFATAQELAAALEELLE